MDFFRFLMENPIMVIDGYRRVLDRTAKQPVTLCSVNKFDFKNSIGRKGFKFYFIKIIFNPLNVKFNEPTLIMY